MRWAVLIYVSVVAASAGARIDLLFDFQQYRYGQPPREFEYDATGSHGPVLAAGRPMWRAYMDLFAPSPKLVLIQASALAEADHYPVAALRDVSLQNVKLAVSFKLLGGNLGRSAGLFWQAQDKNNYHAALVDGLSHELRLVKMRSGRAAEWAKVEAAFDGTAWNSLEVSVQGDRVLLWLNDQRVLEAREPELGKSGRVGLMTHADTIAVFDDFYIQTGEGRILRKTRSAAPQLPVR
jgi:hypothetical protein